MSDYSRAAGGYWAALVSVGALALGWGAFACLSYSVVQWAQLLVLASLVVISGMLPARIPGTKAVVTAGDCFVFLGVIILGVPAGIVLGALELFTGSLRISSRASTWIAVPACMAVTVYIAGHSFYLALAAHAGITRNPVGVGEMLSLEQLALPLVLMALVQYVVNTALLAVLLGLKSNRPDLALLARRLPAKLLDVLRGRVRGRPRLRRHHEIRAALRHPERARRRRHHRHLPRLLRALRREVARGRRGLAPPPRHGRGARHRHRRQRPDDALPRPPRAGLLRRAWAN